ncbi:MAG TPA: GNAT family protein [Kribbella sp.]
MGAAPAHTGHGYATEAVRELIRLCFEDLGLRRVTSNCFAANDASRRLMERVGTASSTRSVSPSTGAESGSTAWVMHCLATSGAASRKPRHPRGSSWHGVEVFTGHVSRAGWRRLR